MEFSGFQWDRGNKDKSRSKHGVSTKEAERCFFNFHVAVVDTKHSTEHERRYILLGETDAQKELFVSFTMRDTWVRIISVRPMHKKERLLYEEEKRKIGF